MISVLLSGATGEAFFSYSTYNLPPAGLHHDIRAPYAGQHAPLPPYAGLNALPLSYNDYKFAYGVPVTAHEVLLSNAPVYAAPPAYATVQASGIASAPAYATNSVHTQGFVNPSTPVAYSQGIPNLPSLNSALPVPSYVYKANSPVTIGSSNSIISQDFLFSSQHIYSITP